MTRVFISHASANSDRARELSEWLRQQRFPEPFLDVEGLRVGQDWERSLYEEIAGCDALLILLTNQWLASKWCFAEFTQARAFGKPVLPLISEAIDERSLDLFVPQIQRLPFWSHQEQALEQLRVALQEITLKTGGGAWPPPDEPGRSPFPGLHPFQESDAAVFFGRESEIRAVLEHLHARRVQWVRPCSCCTERPARASRRCCWPA
ncbi:MAG: toll/interleukin-1 receptor domain-containing protein [Cyanobacteriota bacterium]|nr:toll/interleukin-1 receptor domain-containing protein [Cyanobacteriota bacterium]